MGGGLMQLVAYGAQDVYLTGNPQITFFKVVYRRHTNFSVETISHTFSGQANFGGSAKVTISRNGDLATKMFLRTHTPNVSAPDASPESKFAWVRRLGYALIKKVTIDIGGSSMDKQYGNWMNSWFELARQGDHDRGHANMVGDVAALTRMDGPDSDGLCKRSQVLFVPLYFWFCRNNGLALPLIALQYHEVKVTFEFRDVSELCCYSGGFTSNSLSGLSLGDTTLLVDYVYLDTDERRRFAQVGHEYLIEQVQFGGEVNVSGNNMSNRLNFNHPTKELMWFVKNGEFCSGEQFLTYHHDDSWADAVQGAANNLALGMLNLTAGANVPTIDTDGVDDLSNDWVDPEGDDGPTVGGVEFSVVKLGGDDNDTAIRVYSGDLLKEKTFDLKSRISAVSLTVTVAGVVTSISATHDMTVRDLSRAVGRWTTDGRNAWVKANRDVTVYQHHNTGLQIDGASNPVSQALIQLNGHERFAAREGNYFNYVQPENHHTNTPADGINVYSFALEPEKHQPSGAANLSRIDTTLLNLWFADSSSTGNSSADGFTHDYLNNDNTKLFVYGFSYNVLRIMSGMGGLAYSN